MENIANLTPYFRSLDEEIETQKKINRKNRAFERWLYSNFPSSIEGMYSFSDMGESCIRCFIYLKKDDEQAVVDLLKWIKEMKNRRFKAEKFWRPEGGYFAYKLEREYGNYKNYMVLIENGANIDGCKITQKRKMQKIFVTDCEMENVKL